MFFAGNPGLRQFAAHLCDERRRLDELVTGDLDVRTSLARSYWALPQETRAAQPRP